MEKGYKNLGFVFLLLLVLVFTGFYKTYFGQYPTFNKRINVTIHFHATVLSLWVISLIIQPLLIRYGKLNAHRFIGKLSYVLVPLIICSFVAVIIKEINFKVDVKNMPLAKNIKGSLLSIDGLLLFSINYVLAIVNRRNTPYHMRYMIATGLVIISPGLIRLLIFVFHVPPLVSETVSFAFVDLILIALIFYDKSNNRIYEPYVVSLMLFLLTNVVFIFARFY